MMKGNTFMEQLGEANFQAELLKDPSQALKNIGVDIPADVEVKVVRNGKDSVNIVLPAPSKDTELSDNQLAKIAGGEYFFTVAPATIWAIAGIAAVVTVATTVAAGALTAIDQTIGLS